MVGFRWLGQRVQPSPVRRSRRRFRPAHRDLPPRTVVPCFRGQRTKDKGPRKSRCRAAGQVGHAPQAQLLGDFLESLPAAREESAQESAVTQFLDPADRDHQGFPPRLLGRARQGAGRVHLDRRGRREPRPELVLRPRPPGRRRARLGEPDVGQSLHFEMTARPCTTGSQSFHYRRWDLNPHPLARTGF